MGDVIEVATTTAAPGPQGGTGAGLQVPGDVTSPTLRQLAKERWPEVPTVCMQCPHAVWQETGTGLICYCRVMYRVSWSKEQPLQILSCDGATLGQEREG